MNIGDEYIYIQFPVEEDRIPEFKVDDFWEYSEDIESLRIVDNSTVRTNMIRQTILNHTDDFYFLPIFHSYIDTNDFKLSIISDPFYIGLIASKEGRYNEDYGVFPCSSYKAVELIYKSENHLSIKEEDILIKQLLFYLSNKYQVSFRLGEYLTWYDYFNDGEEKESELENDLREKLVPYSVAMEMYTEALSVVNVEIRFLYFYKIIEYFSPVVAKKRSYELLNQKLDTLSEVVKDYWYLESIFDLTRKYDQSIKDKELANTVIGGCVNIVELYFYLPDNIKRILMREYHFEEIDAIDDKQRIGVIKKISNILYSTRNNFVHAKSNYRENGDECDVDDMEQLNVFMSKLCYDLFLWNGLQEESLRV